MMPMPGLYSAGRNERLDNGSPIAAGLVEDFNDGVKSLPFQPLRSMCLAVDRRGEEGVPTTHTHTTCGGFFPFDAAPRIICFCQINTNTSVRDAAAGMYAPVDTLPDALASDELQSIDPELLLNQMCTNLDTLDAQAMHAAGGDGSALTGDVVSGVDSAVTADGQPTAQHSTEARLSREGNVPPGLAAGGVFQSRDELDPGHLLDAAAEAVSGDHLQDTQHSGEAHGANAANGESEHDAKLEQQQQTRSEKAQEYSYVAAAYAAMAAEVAARDGRADPHETEQQSVHEGRASGEDIRHEAAQADTGVAAEDTHWAPGTGEPAETDRAERVEKSPQGPADNCADEMSEYGERHPETLPEPSAFVDTQPEDGVRAGESAEATGSSPGESSHAAHGQDESEPLHTAETCGDDKCSDTEDREELHSASSADASNTAPMEESDSSAHPVDQQQHYSPDPALARLHHEAADVHQATDEAADVHQHTDRSETEHMDDEEYGASRTASPAGETGRMG